MDVVAWLHGLGLQQYEQAFRDNDIDAGVLLSLTAEDLKDIGVASVGHRRKMLNAIATLRTGSASEPGQAAAATFFPAEGGRRHVTVLFADLAGYTRLSTELDAEEMHGLLGAFFDAVDGVIAAHGGTIDKHIGDCAMAVFGAAGGLAGTGSSGARRARRCRIHARPHAERA